MKMKKYYGVSRSMDKKGKIVKREFKDYTMCIHASVGEGSSIILATAVIEYEDEIQNVPIPKGSK